MKHNLVFYTAAVAMVACLSACNNEPQQEPTQAEIEQRWPATLSTAEAGNFVKIDVQGTSFLMGSTALPDASPVHLVSFTKSYYMGVCEVTQAQWQAVMGSNPSDHKGANYPVESISYNDAKSFVEKLNQQTGRSFRLPTEAEWEFAARGGRNSAGYLYSGSNDINAVAWNQVSQTFEVGKKQANELGLYDMSGNVAEWCADASTPYKAEPQVNPYVKGSSSSLYVYRGGFIDSSTEECQVASRSAATASSSYYSIGLRLLLTAPLDSELLPK